LTEALSLALPKDTKSLPANMFSTPLIKLKQSGACGIKVEAFAPHQNMSTHQICTTFYTDPLKLHLTHQNCFNLFLTHQNCIIFLLTHQIYNLPTKTAK